MTAGAGLPPKAAAALAQAEAMLTFAKLTTEFAEGWARIRREIPEGMLQDSALLNHETQHHFRIDALTRPRLNLPGGETGTVNLKRP